MKDQSGGKQTLSFGLEFELISTAADGGLLTPEFIRQKIDPIRPSWLDWEFSVHAQEVKSKPSRDLQQISHFIHEVCEKVRQFANQHNILLVPFSGIFDPDFELTIDDVTAHPSRQYYFEAWHSMRTPLRRANILFNKCMGTHINIAVPEHDVVRMYNLANLFINPLMALLSAYGGNSHCMRGDYWRQVDQSIRSLWIDGLDDYHSFINTFGIPFTSPADSAVQVFKGWPHVRLKDDIPVKHGEEKLYRLEFAMADMSFIPDQLALTTEFVVQLMSIFHFDRPDFRPKRFDAFRLDERNHKLFSQNGDWREVPTTNFVDERASIKTVLLEMAHIVETDRGKQACTDFIREMVAGMPNGAEMIRTRGLSDQPAIRRFAFDTFTS